MSWQPRSDGRSWQRYLPIWSRDVATDVTTELQHHLDMRAEEYQRRGATYDEAQRIAAERFGDVVAVGSWLQHHDQKKRRAFQRRELMHQVLQDIRLALRQFRRSPGFAFAGIVTLGLAIGATTTVMSIVRDVLVRPLPFANQDQLVRLMPTGGDGSRDAVSPLDFIDLRTQTRTFSALAAINSGLTATLVRPGVDPIRLTEARVSGNFFAVLGVPAQIGRLFLDADDHGATEQALVLSDATWRTLFGADPHVVGTTVVLDGSAHTIVGIAPPSMRYPANTEAWVPLVWNDYETKPDNRGLHELEVIGRRKAGASLAQSSQDLAQFITRMAIPAESPHAGYRIGAAPLADTIIGNVRAPLLALLGAVGFVLLIACTNVANLLLARAVARQAEIGVRAALGASRWRLVRQLVTESVLLAGFGALFGSALALGAVRAVARFGPTDVPRLNEVTVDGQMLLATALIALLTGVAFGLVPALHALNPNLAEMLRAGGRAGRSRATRKLRSALVVVEIAIAVVLLAGAALLGRSLSRLLAVDPGFRAEHVIAFDAQVSDQRYPWDADRRAFATALVARLRQIPSVQSVAIAAARPLDPQASFDLTTSFTIKGALPLRGGTLQQAAIFPVSAEYFSTLGVPVLRGRIFTRSEDRTDGPQALVVNEAFARKYFPANDALGHEIVFSISHHLSAAAADSFRSRGTIVGVVHDIRASAVADPPPPTAYVPYNTLPFSIAMVVRTRESLAALAPALRAAVKAVDPAVPIYSMTAMEDAVAASTTQPRFYAEILAAFAALALLIAAVGTYGVLAYLISQQRRELGIRIALGASRNRIARGVVGTALTLAAFGVLLGSAGAMLATRGLASVLYEITPLDPVSLLAAAGTLLGAAMLAAWIPARRAAGVDPAAVIRAEG